jgi:hypothetical protein
MLQTDYIEDTAEGRIEMEKKIKADSSLRSE